MNALLASRLNDLIVVFVSIVLQSLPFVLIGVFASALVWQFVSEQVVLRWMPRRTLPALLLSSVFGMVVPVCDCGAIPLGRRLAAKSVPPHAAITFMLAAPVVNPVVAASTLVAFQGRWEVVGLRLAMTISVAVAIGLLASRLLAPTERPARLLAPIRGASLDEGPVGPGSRASRVLVMIRHANAEFLDVMFFILLGSLFTAATQTLVPRGDLAAVGSSPIGSVATLMPVATLLSICSEADAFVARAFATTFTLGSVLAFMTIGQIVDLRNGLLLARTLGTRLVLVVVAVSYLLVFVEALAVNAMWPGG